MLSCCAPFAQLLFQSKRPPSPDNKSLIQLTGKRWKEVRSVLTPSFTTNKLRMVSIILHLFELSWTSMGII